MIQFNLKPLLNFLCESKYPFSAIFFCLALHILDVLCLSIDWFPIKFSISNLYQQLKRFNQVTVIEFGFFHRPQNITVINYMQQMKFRNWFYRPLCILDKPLKPSSDWNGNCLVSYFRVCCQAFSFKIWKKNQNQIKTKNRWNHIEGFILLPALTLLCSKMFELEQHFCLDFYIS